MKHLIGKILVIASILLCGYAIVGTIIKNILLKNEGVCTEGILIRELTSYSHRYTKASLVYKFTFNGKIYKGNSLEKDTSKVGDSICVVFLKSFPSINRPVSYFDKGELQCDCNK